MEVVDIDERGGAETVSRITEATGSARFHRVDVSDGPALQRLANQVGVADIVVANAALLGATGSVVDATPEQWDRTFDVNAKGVYLTCRSFLPAMVEQGSGALCLTSSETVLRPAQGMAAYVSAKHAVIGLTRSMAMDFGGYGIRVNAVLPGVTDTQGFARSHGDQTAAALERFARMSPLGVVVRPEQVAEVIAFLCSDRASAVTGSAVTVDAGVTIGYPPKYAAPQDDS